MKTKILIISLSFVITTQTQTIYDVQPGTKGNQINLTVSNISKTTTASNVKMVLVKTQNFLVLIITKLKLKRLNPAMKEQLLSFLI